MALYMKFDSIDGNVSAPGFEKWIEISSFGFGVGRSVVDVAPGRQVNRESSSPSFSAVTVSKTVDVATTALFRQVTGGTPKSVKIVLTRTPDEISPYMEYVLRNVLVSGYSVEAMSGVASPVEKLALNFSALEMRYIPYDKDHHPGSPQVAGYDLASGKTM